MQHTQLPNPSLGNVFPLAYGCSCNAQQLRQLPGRTSFFNGLFFCHRPIIIATMDYTKTLKLRIKDKHAKVLRQMAREVNQVWNHQ